MAQRSARGWGGVVQLAPSPWSGAHPGNQNPKRSPNPSHVNHSAATDICGEKQAHKGTAPQRIVPGSRFVEQTGPNQSKSVVDNEGPPAGNRRENVGHRFRNIALYVYALLRALNIGLEIYMYPHRWAWLVAPDLLLIWRQSAPSVSRMMRYRCQPKAGTRVLRANVARSGWSHVIGSGSNG